MLKTVYPLKLCFAGGINMCGILQCNGGKLEESEGYNCFFIVSCVLESKYRSAIVCELLSNKIKLRFVRCKQLYHS